MKVYYFGCIGEAGHFLWNPDSKFHDTEMYRRQPWGDLLDGELCREAEKGSRGLQTEGAALLHHYRDWTAVAFWDRSGDERRNSNSAFVAKGTYTFDEMIAAAKEQWPDVWARFPFPVRLDGAPG